MEPRPPQMHRLPRYFPLSRLKGATPTKAAIRFRLSAPSSGNPATRVAENTKPTPGAVQSSWSLGTPDRTLPDGFPELPIDVFEALLDPGDVFLDARVDGLRGSSQTVFLGGEHLYQLPPTGNEGAELGCLLVLERSHLGAYCLGEAGQNPGIDGIGLRQRTH